MGTALFVLGVAVAVVALSAAAAGETDESGTGTGAVDATVLGEGATMGHLQACGGQAPLVPVCTTGIHVRQGESFVLGVDAHDYVGVLENRLEWASGSIVLRCQVDGSEIDCTSHEDGFPSAGTPVFHECRSLEPGGEMPGGSGTWRCTFVDEGVPSARFPEQVNAGESLPFAAPKMGTHGAILRGR